MLEKFKKMKPGFFIFLFFLISLSVWFFPQEMNKVYFMGFSDPIILSVEK